MNTLERFMAYAADFEQTLLDDDWSRLEPYFAESSVYRVESDAFGCELTGPAAIFAGMKKSLDGLDRRFTDRTIALTDGPHVEGDELRMAWTVTYGKDDLPPFVLRGQSQARLRDGKLELLVDSFDERVSAELRAWMQETGMQVEPSYT